MNDTSSICFEQGGGNSVFLGRPTALFSSSLFVKDNEDEHNNDGPVVERLMINEDVLNDVNDVVSEKKITKSYQFVFYLILMVYV